MIGNLFFRFCLDCKLQRHLASAECGWEESSSPCTLPKVQRSKGAMVWKCMKHAVMLNWKDPRMVLTWILDVDFNSYVILRHFPAFKRCVNVFRWSWTVLVIVRCTGRAPRCILLRWWNCVMEGDPGIDTKKLGLQTGFWCSWLIWLVRSVFHSAATSWTFSEFWWILVQIWQVPTFSRCICVLVWLTKSNKGRSCPRIPSFQIWTVRPAAWSENLCWFSLAVSAVWWEIQRNDGDWAQGAWHLPEISRIPWGLQFTVLLRRVFFSRKQPTYNILQHISLPASLGDVALS